METPTVHQTAEAGNLTKKMMLKERCPNKIQAYFDRGYPQLGNTFGQIIGRGGVSTTVVELSITMWLFGETKTKENQCIHLCLFDLIIFYQSFL